MNVATLPTLHGKRDYPCINKLIILLISATISGA